LGYNSLKVYIMPPDAESALHDSESGEEPAMPSPRDILIIEDDSAIVDFMTEALKEDGYPVRSAQDGEQGLSEIETALPALVLLDLYMPGITASEFLERLHSNGLSDVPLIIMTADSKAPEYVSIQRDVTFLLKPFDLDMLMACVARFLPPPSTPRP